MAKKPEPEPQKSEIRICQTCSGAGTKTTTQTVKIDGVKQTVSTTVPCPAKCNNGVVNTKLI